MTTPASPPGTIEGGNSIRPVNQFGSFWRGARLSAFEASCLHSFVAAGNEVTLFSYEPVAGIPEGVLERDARDIIEPSRLQRFIVQGQPSISHFSDYFRYIMFAKTPLTWIDTDVFLLESWAQDPHVSLLALETTSSVCNAVLRLSSAEPWLSELIGRVEALSDTDMRHGETGPRLITKLVGSHSLMAQAQPSHLYFPIHFDEFWKVFLPDHAEECRALCSRARTLHLWNNIVDRLGFWKDFLPPAGSYLHELFVAGGCQGYFRGEFPLQNMKQLVENWSSRQTGQHLGIRSVVQQVVPSLRRTLRHYAR